MKPPAGTCPNALTFTPDLVQKKALADQGLEFVQDSCVLYHAADVIHGQAPGRLVQFDAPATPEAFVRAVELTGLARALLFDLWDSRACGNGDAAAFFRKISQIDFVAEGRRPAAKVFSTSGHHESRPTSPATRTRCWPMPCGRSTARPHAAVAPRSAGAANRSRARPRNRSCMR
jgi:hypothetical protein